METYGCVREPPFPSIAVDHVVPDILHLFLRICDVMINLLILELRRLDSIHKKRCSKSMELITVCENYLKESCKINFHMIQGKNSKEMKWRDLAGPEKLRLFDKINNQKFSRKYLKLLMYRSYGVTF